MSKDKDAPRKGSGPGTARAKTLRRELLELESDLEAARRRRDKAQARLEALEAIAEQLGSAIASADAADEARRARRDAADAAAVAASQPAGLVADPPRTSRPTSSAKPARAVKPGQAAKPPKVTKSAAAVEPA